MSPVKGFQGARLRSFLIETDCIISSQSQQTELDASMVLFDIRKPDMFHVYIIILFSCFMTIDYWTCAIYGCNRLAEDTYRYLNSDFPNVLFALKYDTVALS